ncbi:adenosylcobinamide-phosphate synthase CbiB [Paremcibacter congregatus]|uniref:adenosylcobinamide-phosphate synthase CbiB n=1 Tax=Paremcibacter congregatus TaxID=2043170 RepID=UPI001958FAC7|nr:adenosylcobinamide-phosphate synthase CbiB [Paremcibacter congregatus]
MIWSAEHITGLPHLWTLVLVLLLDLLIGDPRWLYRHLPHPVVWMGGLLMGLERLGNRPATSDGTRRIMGGLCLIAYLGTVGAVGYALHLVFSATSHSLISGLVFVLLSSIFLSSRSLIDHVRAVEHPLRTHDIDAARHQVSMIVGRDTTQMNAPAISRAATESLAENFSDGVIAPAFYFLLAGLPGLILYKALNTADSMIGHKNDRYMSFGWAAARLDDLANYIPARLTALLIIGAAIFTVKASPARALHMAQRYAPQHRSPNAGWPESALAGALDFRLGGPRSYHGENARGVWLGEGRENLSDVDIDQSIRVIYRALVIFLFILTFWGILNQ